MNERNAARVYRTVPKTLSITSRIKLPIPVMSPITGERKIKTPTHTIKTRKPLKALLVSQKKANIEPVIKPATCE